MRASRTAARSAHLLGVLRRHRNNRKCGSSKLIFSTCERISPEISAIWARDLKNFRQYCPRPKKKCIKHVGFLETPTYLGLALFIIISSSIIIPRHADQAWSDRDTHDTGTYIPKFRQTCSNGYSDLRFTTVAWDGPGVDSASNRNKYQEYFLGVKAAGA